MKASSKSKKKSQPGSATVTMATAATAQSAGGQGGSNGENTGRWTAEEHNLICSDNSPSDNSAIVTFSIVTSVGYSMWLDTAMYDSCYGNDYY